MQLTWPEVIAHRAKRHHLHERAPREAMLQVVGELVGLHAQVMSSAELTLWARVEGLEPDAVRRELWEERSLVKTWAMRGTLHLLAAADYPLWQAALSTYDHYWRPSWLKALGVTAEQLREILDDVAKALDGGLLTREQIADAVARQGNDQPAERLCSGWGSFLKPVSFRGRLCFAPSEGRFVRFTDPHEWLGGYEERDPDEAIAEMTRRYLAAYGPATLGLPALVAGPHGPPRRPTAL